MRDVVQLFSIALCIAMLYAIWRRGKKYNERAREWYAFIFVALITLVYYIAVVIDSIHDFMSATDVSSTVRLAAIIALTLFVIYAPSRNDK